MTLILIYANVIDAIYSYLDMNIENSYTTQQPKSKSWHKFILIEMALDFAVIFLPTVVRVVMGRELFSESYYNVPFLILTIIGIRLLFLSLSALPSIRVSSQTFFDKKKDIQRLVVVLSIFAVLLINNIDSFFQHFDYSMYEFIKQQTLFISSLQVLFLRNIFDFVPRAFRNSPDALVNFLYKIAYTISALTIIGSLLFSILLAIGLYFNFDQFVF